MSIHFFVDSDHAGENITRRAQTGVLIIINRAQILWFSKKQNLVHTSTFVSEFTAMNQAVELTQSLCYKLGMFGIILIGPGSVYFDNYAVYNNVSIPESILNKNHHSVLYNACREAVASDMIRVAKEDIMTNLANYSPR